MKFPILLNDWAEVSSDYVMSEFNETLTPEIELLIASYTYESYSGTAFVLYRDKNTKKLFEVNASHCSCYGLENQWSPEETSVEAIQFRIDNAKSRNWQDEYADELQEVLKMLKNPDIELVELEAEELALLAKLEAVQQKLIALNEMSDDEKLAAIVYSCGLAKNEDEAKAKALALADFGTFNDMKIIVKILAE